MKQRLPTFILLLTVIGLLILLLSSCMTSDKATGYLSAHREVAANYCAAQFPIKSESVITTTIDTAGYENTVNKLMDYADSVTAIAGQRNDSIELLRDKVNEWRNAGLYTQATADVLQAQISGIKKIDTAALRKSIEKQVRSQIKPCVDTVITVVKENTARVEAATLRGERLQNEKDQMINNRDQWRKWFFILLGLVIVFAVLRSFTAKLGIVGRFIK